MLIEISVESGQSVQPYWKKIILKIFRILAQIWGEKNRVLEYSSTSNFSFCVSVFYAQSRFMALILSAAAAAWLFILFSVEEQREWVWDARTNSSSPSGSTRILLCVCVHVPRMWEGRGARRRTANTQMQPPQILYMCTERCVPLDGWI